MANFNLSDYATVAERLAQLKLEYPDYRIITEDLTSPQDRSVSTWRVKATLFLTSEDQERNLPKATGHAFEIDGQGMANKTSALENAESSAIGRCLMVAGWAMSKKNLASAEEMAKVARGETPIGRDWIKEAKDKELVYDLQGVRALYSEMVRLKAPANLIEEVKQIGAELSATQDSGSQPGGN